MASKSEPYELFFGRDCPFSQHYICRFEVDDIRYFCAEQYMMYHKAEVFCDDNIKKKVLASSSPVEIKHLGREVHNFDIVKWMKHAVEIVKRGNMAKFSQNPRLLEILFNTHPKQLVEASPTDTRWGIGIATHNPSALDERLWRGRNLLGKILTNIRDEFMIEKKYIKTLTLPTLESDQSSFEQEERRIKTVQEAKFEFFWKKDSPFSNLHECDFVVDDVPFVCLDQFMLYRKAVLFKNTKLADEILTISSSNQLYKDDFSVHDFDKHVWFKEREEIYKEGVTAKFTQHGNLMSVLLQTYPKIILRASHKEKQHLMDHPESFKPNEYRGHWFEICLMNIRDELCTDKSEYMSLQENNHELREFKEGSIDQDADRFTKYKSTNKRVRREISIDTGGLDNSRMKTTKYNTECGQINKFDKYTSDTDIQYTTNPSNKTLSPKDSPTNNECMKDGAGTLQSGVQNKMKRRETTQHNKRGKSSKSQDKSGDARYSRKSDKKVQYGKNSDNKVRETSDEETVKEIDVDYRTRCLEKLEGTDKYTLISIDSPLWFDYICQFQVDDVVFRSVEQYTGYKKADYFNDIRIKQKILEAETPKDIKVKSCEVRNLKQKEWFAIAARLYDEGCEAKFKQNPELKKQLFNTYPTIIHQIPRGSGWGMKLSEVDISQLDKEDRTNKSEIKNVLTNVRDALMKEDGLIDK